MADDDFASLLRAADATASARGARRLEAGQPVEGTVLQVTVDTVFVDIGAPGDARVDRSEVIDADGRSLVNAGDRIRATVLDPRPDAPRLTAVIGLATAEADAGEGTSEAAPALPAPDEVLDAKVIRCLDHGVLVDTPKGRGLIPVRDLDLSHGADHRRAVPVGTQLRVVLSSIDEGKQRLRFSVSGVHAVEEKRHAREYAERSGGSASSFGSLGDLMARPSKKPAPAAARSEVSEQAQRSDPSGVVRRQRRDGGKGSAE
jgi:ribosomal protein S1